MFGAPDEYEPPGGAGIVDLFLQYRVVVPPVAPTRAILNSAEYVAQLVSVGIAQPRFPAASSPG
jgi:hypothetical protein